MTNEQVKRILPIVKNHVTEMVFLRNKYEGDRAGLLRHMQQLQEQTDKKLDSILTAAQRIDLDNFLNQS